MLTVKELKIVVCSNKECYFWAKKKKCVNNKKYVNHIVL